ncbi:hypothetical protein PUN28_016689 [Cardiocondyla obscurior]|uniref:Uncharacterized protein n=1 Tax=Cardiocondyla obscurior TaxID=286306 RepID=A0AAW2EQD0_9HYME
MSEKSSTRMISCMRCSGDLTDQASLWKQMITAVGGRSFRYLPDSLHLQHKGQRRNVRKLNMPTRCTLDRRARPQNEFRGYGGLRTSRSS